MSDFICPECGDIIEPKSCIDCGGKGEKKFIFWSRTCPSCKGRGFKPCVDCKGKGTTGKFWRKHKCKSCNGYGVSYVCPRNHMKGMTKCQYGHLHPAGSPCPICGGFFQQQQQRIQQQQQQMWKR